MSENSNSEMLADELAIMAVRLIRWLRAADERPSLSGPEASALAVIIHSGGLSPSALADLEQVRRPTITRTVDSLAKRGLVERRPNPIDKRAVQIVVTPQGAALWQAGQLRKIAPLVDRINSLSAEERAQLEAALPLLKRITSPPPV